jgi:hypothetical protein
MWKFIHNLRLKLQCFYKCQHGRFQLPNQHAGNVYALSEEEAEHVNSCLILLRKVYSHVLAIRAMEKIGAKQSVVEFDASLQKNISHCHSLGYLLLSELRYV